MWYRLLPHPTEIKKLIFAIMIVCAVFTNVYAQPSIKLSKSFINFEKIVKGETHSAEIIIENNGDDTLGIINIHTSCSCVNASLKDKSIYPHKYTKLEIKFDSGSKPVGPTHQEIILKTNDPEYEIVKIVVLGYIEESKKGLEFSVPVINFGTIPKGYHGKKDITITNHDKISHTIIEIIPEFGVSVEKTKNIFLPAQTKTSIPVQISQWIKPGIFSSSITLRTTDPANPMVQLKVTARIIEHSRKKYNQNLESGRF